MQCSYVVTDPKGTVLEEVGTMLARGAWELDDKGNKVPKVGKNGQVLKTKSGKVIYKRTPYKIKVFNTINFAKSMHYNRATCSPLKRRRTALFLISSVN